MTPSNHLDVRSRPRSRAWDVVVAPLCLLAVGVIAFTPTILIADLGGVLPWTQWLAGVLVLFGLLALIPVVFARDLPTSRLVVALPAIILAGCVWAFVQQTQLPEGCVRLLSPGSGRAFAMVASTQSAPHGSTISLAANSTLHLLSLGIVIATAMWTIMLAIRTPRHVMLVLAVFAITGAALSVAGMIQLLVDSSTTITGHQAAQGGYPFGTFINRNNAALILNLAVAATLGILIMKCVRIPSSGQPLHNRFDTAIQIVTGDLTILLWLIVLGVLVAGLCACGSRGGLLGSIAGAVAAIGFLVRIGRLRLTTSLMIVGGVGVAAMVVVNSIGIDPQSISRMDRDSLMTAIDAKTDPRLLHWPDGWRASLAYLPGGAGLGAYRFAYLPFQESTPNAWYQHADNLWLEWWTEMGLIGAVLWVSALLVLAATFKMIRQSTNPLDIALAAGAAYAVAAILISQFFDFGLLWPGAALMTVALVGLPITRASLVAQTSCSSSSSSSRNQRLGSVLNKPMSSRSTRGITIGFLSLAALATWQLHNDAHADYAKRWGDRVQSGSLSIAELEHVGDVFDRCSRAHRETRIFRSNSRLCRSCSPGRRSF